MKKSNARGLMLSINISNSTAKWSKNSLAEITKRIQALGKVNGFVLDVWHTNIDTHHGFIVCGSHVFAVTNDVKYIVGRAYSKRLARVKDATASTPEHARMFDACVGLDMNPDGVAFYPLPILTPADNAKLIAEYVFGVLVQDALHKATFTQLVNSIVCETLHPKTLMKLRQDGYLLNTFEQVQKTFKRLAHASIVPCKEILY
jgi:hypothetical protein